MARENNKNALRHGIFSKELTPRDKKLFNQLYKEFLENYDLSEFKQQLILQKLLKVEILVNRIETEISSTQLGEKCYLLNYYNMFLTQQRKLLSSLELPEKERNNTEDIAFYVRN